MNLSQAQKTKVKTHVAANTNQTPAVDSTGQPLVTPFAVNTYQVNTADSEKERAIAEWYNGLALAGDAQPFAVLFLWNPRVTEAMLSTAVDWTAAPPHGLGGSPTVDQQQLAVGNKWWLWDALVGRKGYIDFTDSQARNGVLQVWGNVGPVNTNTTTASAIGSETISPLVAKLAARRIDLAMLNAGPLGGTGAKTAWAAAVVGAVGVVGQVLTQPDVHDLLLQG